MMTQFDPLTRWMGHADVVFIITTVTHRLAPHLIIVIIIVIIMIMIIILYFNVLLRVVCLESVEEQGTGPGRVWEERSSLERGITRNKGRRDHGVGGGRQRSGFDIRGRKGEQVGKGRATQLAETTIVEGQKHQRMSKEIAHHPISHEEE